jgi:hypothetical protein
MIVQGMQHHDLRGDLPGFAIIAAVGLALIALTPAPALSSTFIHPVA